MPNVQSNNSTEICAFFKDRSDALAAIADLKDAGFTSDQIGLAMADDPSLTSSEPLRTDGVGGPVDTNRASVSHGITDDRSAWDKIKDFFTGGHETYIGDEQAHESTYGNISSERARYYNSGIAAGGAVLTVSAPATRLTEAREILEDHEADVRTSGFEETSRANWSGSSAGAAEAASERRIQLRGEMLRAVKQKVEKGEIRLRKDIVTENQTISVPVTREEVVVEQVSAGEARPLSGTIGDEGEIRIPVSEERVSVVKEPVVTGEVRVQKRAVQDNQQVSDTVRHEEVRMEKQGSVDVNEKTTDNPTTDKTKTGRKKPAA
ncbi:MAG TPA: YsnF/AvaK domain-containing protein [Blattabacteriaceae bacterium]|nr:YsnF/AvaK domain-containing protein [Blattabacteriaceae bacterium]